MSLTCPHCHSRLPLGAIRKVFYCPSCNTRLAANTMGPLLLAIGVWSFSDLLIQSDVYATLGVTLWPGIAMRVGLTVLAAWVIVRASFTTFIKVRLAPRPRWR